MNLQSGQVVDSRYEIVSLLGSGAFGSVYKARQSGFDRLVALKILKTSDASLWKRFEQEAKILTSLHHRNIVTLYGYGVFEDKPYLATELVEGLTLRELLKTVDHLDPVEAVEFAKQLCSALSCAHASGIVHRDLNPNNILCTSVSNESVETGALIGSNLKVIDFGLAKLLSTAAQPQQSITVAGRTVGSVFYMSPEQCTGGRIDQRADIYAVGCVLFECLSGKPPFQGIAEVDVMEKHLHDPVPKLPESNSPALVSQLQAIINTAIAKDPARRYPSAQALLEDLEALSDVLSDSQKVQVLPASVRSSVSKSTKALLAILIGIAGLAIVMYFAGTSLNSVHNRLVKSTGIGKQSWILPSQRIRSLCDRPHELSEIAMELDKPNTSVDRAELDIAYAKLLPASKAVSFIEQRLRKTTDPEECVRLYVLLGNLSLSERGLQFCQRQLHQAVVKVSGYHLSAMAQRDVASAYLRLQRPRDSLNSLAHFDNFPHQDPRYDELMFYVACTRIGAAARLNDSAVIGRELTRLEQLLQKHKWMRGLSLLNLCLYMPASPNSLDPILARRLSACIKPIEDAEMEQALLSEPPPPGSSLSIPWISAVNHWCAARSLKETERRCRTILSMNNVSQQHPSLQRYLRSKLADTLDQLADRPQERALLQEQCATSDIQARPPAVAMAVIRYLKAAQLYEDEESRNRTLKQALLQYHKLPDTVAPARVAEIIYRLMLVGRMDEAAEALNGLMVRCQATREPVLNNVCCLFQAAESSNVDETITNKLYQCLACEIGKKNDQNTDRCSLISSQIAAIQFALHRCDKRQASRWARQAVDLCPVDKSALEALAVSEKAALLQAIRFGIIAAREMKQPDLIRSDQTKARNLVRLIDSSDAACIGAVKDLRKQYLQYGMTAEANWMENQLKRMGRNSGE
jgi:serine/threonine protein kinase